jgi:hypothetical protein
VWWEAIFEIGLDARLNFPESFGIVPCLNKLRLMMTNKTDISTYRSDISRRDNLNRHVAMWYGASFDSRSPSRNIGEECRMVLSGEITMELYYKNRETHRGLPNAGELGPFVPIASLNTI